MSTTPAPRLTDDVPGGLRDVLGTPAPVHVREHVLVETGLADHMAPIDSPLGTLWVAWNGRGVSEVEQAEHGAEAAARHEARTGRRTTLIDTLPEHLRTAIGRRLAGETRVRIPLDLRGRSEFEVAVWTKALEIPRGEVRPYGWVAAEIGRPKAVRAVGTALAHNPVPLVVPCHRVVRSDGTIGRYSLGGPENKRRVLAAEGLDPDALEAAAGAGIRFLGSDTTHIVCLPTCQHARRITAGHRVPFSSLGAARAAGYRPCLRCRPVSLAA